MHSFHRRFTGIVVLPVCSVFVGTVLAETIYVPGDYPTIQEAIDVAATSGDEIIVAPGTYPEAINYLGKTIYLHSSDGPDVTTIDATGLRKSVVTCSGSAGPDMVLQGFTITGGRTWDGGGLNIRNTSLIIRRCIITRNVASDGAGLYGSGVDLILDQTNVISNESYDSDDVEHGGGIFVSGGSLELIDCEVNSNVVSAGCWAVGGGIYGTGANVSALRCSFASNRTIGGACAGNSAGDAGAIYMDSGELTLQDCSFRSCSAYGVLSGEAGAIYAKGPVSMTDCSFTQNNATAFYDGTARGGAMILTGSPIDMLRCDFTGNWTYASGSYYGAGNLTGSMVNIRECNFVGNKSSVCGALRATTATIHNSTFIRNSADRDGGAILAGTVTVINSVLAQNSAGANGGAIKGTVVNLINSTITDNSARGGGGIHLREGDIHNSIVWNNTPDQMTATSPTLTTVNYSNIERGWTGEGTSNIDSDPLFVDPANDDYRLSSGSPCIDAGDNDLVPPDVTADIAGNPRFVDDLGKPDIGNGVAPIVDIGAYEYQDTSHAALTVVPTPLVGRGKVGFDVTNGRPNARIWLLRSTTGLGSTYIALLNVTIDLDQPQFVAGPGMTDANGNHRVILNARSVTNVIDVWFQAVQFGVASNYVGTRIVPE